MKKLCEAFDRLQENMSQTGGISLGDIIRGMEPAFQQEGYRNPLDGALKRILIVRLDEIGDNVLTSAFLRELRRNFPNAVIDLLVKPVVYPIMELCPYIDHAIQIANFPKDNSFGIMALWIREVCEAVLWPNKYDACIVPRWDVDETFSTLLAFLSGAQMRIGYSAKVYPMKAEQDMGGDYLLTHKALTPPYIVHEVEKNLFLLKSLGCNVISDAIELWLSEVDQESAKRYMDAAGGGGFVAVAVGTREGRKTYPPEKIAQVLRELLPTEAKFLLLGGKDDVRSAEIVRGMLPEGRAVNLAGKTSLRVSAAVISLSDLYLGGDTGLTHIAAAAHRPVVEWNCHPMDVPVSVVSLLARFFPWQTSAAVVRPKRALEGCGQLTSGFPELAGCQSVRDAHCICTIEPHSIATAAKRFLEAQP